MSAPVALGHPADPNDPDDVRITIDDAPLACDQDDELGGRVVASYVRERPLYTLIDRGEAGHLFRFHGFADVEMRCDSGEICCRLVAGAEREMLPVILAGNVMAAFLLLRGALTLHASAVERAGRTVALIASSGGGKSTLAAMACAAGARLITDDVLRLDVEADRVKCHRGTGALRLRPGSRALAGNASADVRSADGRHLLGVTATPYETMTLDAVVIVRLGPPEIVLERTELPAKAGLLALVQHPRVENWVDPVTSAAHFANLVSLVGRVPVAHLDVPWGVERDLQWFERLNEVLFAAPGAPPTAS